MFKHCRKPECQTLEVLGRKSLHHSVVRVRKRQDSNDEASCFPIEEDTDLAEVELGFSSRR